MFHIVVVASSNIFSKSTLHPRHRLQSFVSKIKLAEFSLKNTAFLMEKLYSA